MRCIVYVLVTKVIRAQKSRTTYLHHVKYDHQDYLAWTIEVCSSCHFQIDEYNRKQVNRHYGRPDPQTHYNIRGRWIPMKDMEKEDSKRETMSSVSRRYC